MSHTHRDDHELTQPEAHEPEVAQATPVTPITTNTDVAHAAERARTSESKAFGDDAGGSDPTTSSTTSAPIEASLEITSARAWMVSGPPAPCWEQAFGESSWIGAYAFDVHGIAEQVTSVVWVRQADVQQIAVTASADTWFGRRR